MVTINPEMILNHGWGLNLKPLPVDLGENNTTWKVDQQYWLTYYALEKAGQAIREIQLYDYLNQLQQNEEQPILFPVIVRTKSDKPYYKTSLGIWRLTKHLPGKTPERTNLLLYAEIAKGLARLHKLLAKVPQHYAVSKISLVEKINHYLQKIDIPNNIISEEDCRLVAKTASYLIDHFSELNQLEKQLIHGDFSHPNIRISDDKSPKMIAVLDFEFCSVDPVIFDLATVILTAINRSDANNMNQLVGQIIDSYQLEIDKSINLDQLRTAIIAREFGSYWNHCLRWVSGKGSKEAFERQIIHLNKVWLFFQSNGILHWRS